MDNLRINQNSITNEYVEISSKSSKLESFKLPANILASPPEYSGENVKIKGYVTKNKNLIVIIPDTKLENVNISPYTHQLLDFFVLALTQRLDKNMSFSKIIEACKFEIPLDSFLSVTKTKDSRAIRNHLKEIFIQMMIPIIVFNAVEVERDKEGNVKFETIKENGEEVIKRIVSKKKKWGVAHIIESIKIDDDTNKIIIKFGEEYVKHLADWGYLMKYPDEMFQISTQYNPYSFNLGRKMLVHRHTNEKSKKTRNTLSVKSLLSQIPDFPTVESLPRQDMFRERIVKPFERDMNKLIELGVIARWNYNLDKRVYDGKININNFYDLYINFYFPEDELGITQK